MEKTNRTLEALTAMAIALDPSNHPKYDSRIGNSHITQAYEVGKISDCSLETKADPNTPTDVELQAKKTPYRVF
jgi:hypothetical protein